LPTTVIIGGRQARRGVGRCYVSRTYGVRSAMPMFKGARALPTGDRIPPDMAKYVRVGREVRQAMQTLTPLVEPLVDRRGFLDLAGTQRSTHDPGKVLGALCPRRRARHRHSVSVGLSCNNFWPDRSDLDKPRGFARWTRTKPRDAGRQAGRVSSTASDLRPGKTAAARLPTIADLQRADEVDLMKQFRPRPQAVRLARGIDDACGARSRRQDDFQEPPSKKTSAISPRWKRSCGAVGEVSSR